VQTAINTVAKGLLSPTAINTTYYGPPAATAINTIAKDAAHIRHLSPRCGFFHSKLLSFLSPEDPSLFTVSGYQVHCVRHSVHNALEAFVTIKPAKLECAVVHRY
jgi:hypothetical protein